MVKDKNFQLRLTKEELRKLHTLAERSGVSASDFIRAYIRRAAARKGI